MKKTIVRCVCFCFYLTGIHGAEIDANFPDFQKLQLDPSVMSDRDGKWSLEEPPIQSLALSSSVTLSGGNSIFLNSQMSPNPEITTQAGINLFYPYNDSLLVKKDGLYRVSFFQRAFNTGTSKSSSGIFLLLTPGNYVKRYQVFDLQPNSAGEINFNQIIRINNGQKIAVVIRNFQGEMRLSPDFNSSGLTVEAFYP